LRGDERRIGRSLLRLASIRRAGEQQQVAVRVIHDEIPCAPGLVLERLVKRDAGRLKLEEQLLDFLGGLDARGNDRGLSIELAIAIC
jgi:hypothetical protein